VVLIDSSGEAVKDEIIKPVRVEVLEQNIDHEAVWDEFAFFVS
jgi:hypothetical protein